MTVEETSNVILIRERPARWRWSFIANPYIIEKEILSTNLAED